MPPVLARHMLDMSHTTRPAHTLDSEQYDLQATLKLLWQPAHWWKTLETAEDMMMQYYKVAKRC